MTSPSLVFSTWSSQDSLEMSSALFIGPTSLLLLNGVIELPFCISMHVPTSRHRVLLIPNSYTQYIDDQGMSRSRYTKREVIPHYRHVIVDHRDVLRPKNSLQNRGYTVNPAWSLGCEGLTSAIKQQISWRWHNGPNTACPVRIPLCYADYDTYRKLGAYIPVAISIWHDALGKPSYRGVEFKFIGEGSKSICPKAEEIGAKDANGNLKYPNVPHDAVWIRDDVQNLRVTISDAIHLLARREV